MNNCKTCAYRYLHITEVPCAFVHLTDQRGKESARMDKGLRKILRNGFTYDERRNSYNGTVCIVGIDWKDDLEQKLREYFKLIKKE